MTTIKLGKLQEVDIRKLWNHEQYDLSEWLSKAENLKLLNEAIGLTLSEVEKEVYVGLYRCGLVLRVAQKGENAGNQFYGCSAFPKCRYTRDIE